MGNGQWAMGNGQWAMGSGDSPLPLPHFWLLRAPVSHNNTVHQESGDASETCQIVVNAVVREGTQTLAIDCDWLCA
jgi:hypothetical protein